MTKVIFKLGPLNTQSAGGGAQQTENLRLKFSSAKSVNMVSSKKFILAKHFVGKPSNDDIKLVTEELSDELDTGEVLCEAVWLSVDPYMRIFSESLSEGDVIMGEQVARIIKSKNSKFPKDTHVLAHLGWRSHTLVKDISVLHKVPDIEDLPLSLALGCLGMPGLTAYFGLLEKCQPKAGETVLVSAAAGAVGSVVGQIAKIKGCKVVAFAGTEEKCSWLKNELNFDQVFNYKDIDLDKVLSSAVPGGIDCYFDNVGGDFTSTVLNHMNDNGRICICGNISHYNVKDKNSLKGAYPFSVILMKELAVLGFKIMSYMDRAAEGRKELLKWIKKEKLKYRETITEGFENMPEAFFGLFEGSNIGKAVVKA